MAHELNLMGNTLTNPVKLLAHQAFTAVDKSSLFEIFITKAVLVLVVLLHGVSTRLPRLTNLSMGATYTDAVLNFMDIV